MCLSGPKGPHPNAFTAAIGGAFHPRHCIYSMSPSSSELNVLCVRLPIGVHLSSPLLTQHCPLHDV